MSTQKGNINRTRPQKYKNAIVFKNNLYDTSKQQKKINNLEVCFVCEQCKSVIEWKIKYKKYKPLAQPKTCIHCHEKTIKFAYHSLCGPCGAELKVCCKCKGSKDIVQPNLIKTKEEILLAIEPELKRLPERKRRAFKRYLDSKYERKKKKQPLEEEDHCDDYVEIIPAEPAPRPRKGETLENARIKLDELTKDLHTDDDDFYSDDSDGE